MRADQIVFVVGRGRLMILVVGRRGSSHVQRKQKRQTKSTVVKKKVVRELVVPKGAKSKDLCSGVEEARRVTTRAREKYSKKIAAFPATRPKLKEEVSEDDIYDSINQ
jgi:hypothetical protein